MPKRNAFSTQIVYILFNGQISRNMFKICNRNISYILTMQNTRFHFILLLLNLNILTCVINLISCFYDVMSLLGIQIHIYCFLNNI